MAKPVYIFVRDVTGHRIPNPRAEFNGVWYNGTPDGTIEFGIWDGETHARYTVVAEGFIDKIIDTDIGPKMYCESVTLDTHVDEPDVTPAKNFWPNGENLYNDDGVFRVQGLSVFHDFLKWLRGDRNTDLNKWAKGLGVNWKRVFGSSGYDGIDFNPYDDYDRYFKELPLYLEYQMEQGFCIEFTPLCRAEVFDTQQKCDDFTYDISEVLARYDFAWHNLANEPYKNLPKDVTPQSLVEHVQTGAMYDLGSTPPPSEDAYEPTGVGVTGHADRGPEWVRKARQGQEVRERYHKPFLSDEPMGADAVNQPGSRSNVPLDFYNFHALASMYYGNVIHFTQGRYGNMPTGKERECVEAGAMAWRDVPSRFLEGNFAYLTKNTGGQKCYGVELGGEGCSVIAVPDGSELIPNDGWRITKSMHGIVFLMERV